MKEYNKLIRDKIPEIIEAAGKQCIVEVMSEEEYLEEKKNKKNSAFDILDTIEFDEKDKD